VSVGTTPDYVTLCLEVSHRHTRAPNLYAPNLAHCNPSVNIEVQAETAIEPREIQPGSHEYLS